MVAFTPILGIRAAQIALSLLVLGLDGATITAFNNYAAGSSPSSVNFLLFCCIWSWIALAYLLVTPRFLPRLHDKFAVLGVEIVTNIFWFSGWVSVAALLGGTFVCSGNACGIARAAIAFGCFAWLSWTASLVLISLSIFKNTNMGGAMPMMAAQHAPLGGAGVESGYGGAGAYNNPSSTPMGFNPSETPAPYSATSTPAPYDPHMQPAHLQPQPTGVSAVSDLSSGPYADPDPVYSARINTATYGQSTPYDPHYSQHQDYSGAAEMPAASGYGGQVKYN